jgi:hypothetical protein
MQSVSLAGIQKVTETSITFSRTTIRVEKHVLCRYLSVRGLSVIRHVDTARAVLTGSRATLCKPLNSQRKYRVLRAVPLKSWPGSATLHGNYTAAWVVTLVRWFVAGFSWRRPGFEPKSGHVGFVVDKVGRFSLSTSVSPANSHSTECSTLITYHPGLVQ